MPRFLEFGVWPRSANPNFQQSEELSARFLGALFVTSILLAQIHCRGFDSQQTRL